jgi:hypothetical protein
MKISHFVAAVVRGPIKFGAGFVTEVRDAMEVMDREEAKGGQMQLTEEEQQMLAAIRAKKQR